MKLNSLRFKSAAKAMVVHFGVSLLVALAVAALVFAVWFPYPYRQLAGGTELFFLVMGVDLVCGPLLTFVLYNPVKPKRELMMDLSIVVALQLTALVYGIWTVHTARPLYLVHEFDRFKVITLADIDSHEIAKLSENLQTQLFKGPQTVGLRDVSKDEREKVMFESVLGGRDYGEHPEFYAKYEGAKAYLKARPASDFVKKHPNKQEDFDKLTGGAGAPVKEQWRYMPVIARQDWVAILDSKGDIVGYLKGDGF